MSNSWYAHSDSADMGGNTQHLRPTNPDAVSQAGSSWAGIGTWFGRRRGPSNQGHTFQPGPPVPPKSQGSVFSGQAQADTEVSHGIPVDTEERIRQWDARVPPPHEQPPPDVRSEADAPTIWDAASVGETFAKRTEGPNEAKLPKVYYRIYARNFYHPLISKQPIHLDDPALTFSILTWIAPPLTAARVSSFICGREGLPLKGATLYLSQLGNPLAEDALIVEALNATSVERPLCLVVDISHERILSHESQLHEMRSSAAFAQAQGPGLATLTKVYYRLNDSRGLPLASERPLFEDDNSLSFINLEWVTPPVNAESIRAFICGHEQLHKSRGTLYISQTHTEPAALDNPWSTLLTSEHPPTDPEHPLRIVVTLAPGGREASALSKWRASPSESVMYALYNSGVFVGMSARNISSLFRKDAATPNRPHKIRKKRR